MVALLLVGLLSIPVQPRWVYQQAPGFVCSPLVADLNTHPGVETVALGRGGEIVCLGADGSLLWRVQGEAEYNNEPAIIDINGDHRLEIVAVDRDGVVVCLTGAGGQLWRRQLGGLADWSSVVGSPAGHGGFVVIARTDGVATCLGPQGEVRWETKLPSDCFTLPALADVDGDGRPECLVASFKGFLTCIGADGTVCWTVRPIREDLMGPVCADINGDGALEILAGGGSTLYAFEGRTGRTLWSFAAKAPWIDASISVADLDGDGRPEIVFTEIPGRAYCLDAAGKKRWEYALHGKAPYAAAIGDVDGDGRLEVVLTDRDGFVYFLTADGKLKQEMRVDGGMNASPALADIDGDGRVEMALATETGRVYAIRLGKYRGLASLPWPSHRWDLSESAAIAGRPAARLTPWPLPSPKALASGGIQLDVGAFLLGADTIRATARNPIGRPARLVITAADPSGLRHTAASDSQERTIQATLDLPVLAGGRYRVQAALKRLSDGAVLATAQQSSAVTIGAADRRLVAGAIAQVRASAARLRASRPADARDLDSRAYGLEQDLARLLEQAPTLTGLNWRRQREVIAFAADLREQAADWARVASYSARHFSTAKALPFVAWQSNPWDTLPHLARPIGAPISQIKVSVLGNEWESVCLNLSNLTSRTLSVRVRPHDAGEGNLLPRDKVTIREVTEIAVARKEGPAPVYADFLPVANQADYFVLPPWESRQVWLTLDSRGLAPGEYQMKLVLAETAPEPGGQVLTLALRVRPVALPAENPFQSCWWSYIHINEHPEWARFQAEHYLNLFPGAGIPLGEFDAEGNMVKAPDFTQVDAYVKLRQSAGPSKFLFSEPFISLTGGFESDEPALLRGRLVDLTPRARRMYQQWLPVVVKHLQGLGLDYGDWAFYPIDEPARGPSCLIASLSKAAKAIDPRVRFYIDFISLHDVYDVDTLLPYIDLWCPQPEVVFDSEPGRRLIRQVLEAGKQMVCYGILTTESTWRPYRLMPWQCAKYGLSGAGGWVFIAQAQGMWRGDPLGGDGHSANAGWEAIYPSKRMEAYREGVEDYLYLYLLGQLADKAQAAGRAGEAQQARALRQQAIDAVVADRGKYETIRRYRERLGDMIESLAGKVGG